MSSIIQSFHKRRLMPLTDSLPLSHHHQQQPDQHGLRRRLSSLSLNINFQPPSSSTWTLRRSKSLSAMGEEASNSLRKWWEWGWSWILSRKPIFASDLEMNKDEAALLGSHNKGSWRHVFYKLRSEMRKLFLRSGNNGGLPQTNCRYDSSNYRKNFDDGSTSDS